MAFSLSAVCPAVASAQPACAEPVALFESIRNDVQLVSAATRLAVLAERQVPVCAGDTIAVGDRSRAVVVMLASNTVLAIDQNSVFTVTAPRSGAPSFIDLLRGALLFITRAGSGLVVGTPFVSAAVEGTEFVIRVQPDRSIITVIEGTVRATNVQGTLLINAGRQAVAVQGEAPQLEVGIRPRDAVQWALYYEPILPLGSFAELATVPEAARDATFHVRRATLLLAAGRLDDALADLDRAAQLDPAGSDEQILRAIVAVALDDKPAALEAARLAVERAPQSASAHLALSYAWQASFDLESALDAVRQATELAPQNGAAWARLAELRLALDDVAGAAAAAEQAVTLAPQDGRPRTIAGFVALAQGRLSEAEETLEEAVRAAPDAPLTRLALGLVDIGRGALTKGRLELEVAAALDPDNAIIRSYLAKAYLDEGRADLATEQLALAQTLDPLDPTPWFYDALQKHARNRPVEALTDLRRSIQLNDNRAVYRSRLLLDSDTAVRGARLGRLYRDLGFEQLALLAGWTSLAADPSNYSAHRLLADNYLALPRHEIARDSELLQSQLMQPLNLDPIQPRLAQNGLVFLDDGGIASAGLNEYSRLFVTDHVRLVADGLAGNRDTVAGNAILSGIYRRVSFSVGQFHYSSDGVRANHDTRQNLSNGFVQATLSSRTSVQAEFRAGDERSGDRRMLFDRADHFPALRLNSDTWSIRLGARQTIAPGSMLVASYVHRRRTDDLDVNPQLAIALSQTADFGEARYLHAWQRVQFTGGASYYTGDRSETVTFGPLPPVMQPFETRHVNAYAYATVNVAADASVAAGLSTDAFSEGPLERRQINPKVGLIWPVTSRATLRAAAFRTMKRTLVSSQTIEPTQVAGFNQFFDDPNATDAWRYGAALDHTLGGSAYAGIEASVRDLTVPETDLVQGGRLVLHDDVREKSWRAYLYSTFAGRIATRAEYRVDRVNDPQGRHQVNTSITHRIPLEVRIFDDSGALVRVEATYVNQHGVFQHLDGARFRGSEVFWTVDGAVGFRFGRGVATLEIRNAFDTAFRFQDLDPTNPTILPGRRIIGRVTVGF